jgi:hypothetical protein
MQVNQATLSTLNFPASEERFLVANSPLFLLRGVRSDPAVISYASSTPPEEIYGALRHALSQDTGSLRDRSLPYSLFVALSMAGGPPWVREALNLDLGRNRAWLELLAERLLAEAQNTTVTVRPIGEPRVTISNV